MSSDEQKAREAASCPDVQYPSAKRATEIRAIADKLATITDRELAGVVWAGDVRKLGNEVRQVAAALVEQLGGDDERAGA